MSASISEQKPYSTTQARGEIRVMVREDGFVGINVFGTYALLTEAEASHLGGALYDASNEAFVKRIVP